MGKILLLTILVFTIGFAHLSVVACMCAGVNPDIYPPDISASRIYYRDDFKGAAFTGKVLSSSQTPDLLLEGEKVQEVTIEVDRYWFGVSGRVVKIYTPVDSAGCWAPFHMNESYFFIPKSEKQMLYLGVCTYATFNRKSDGNYVDFMIKMFGQGKRHKPEK